MLEHKTGNISKGHTDREKGGPIGTHQSSFERYQRRPPTASSSPRFASPKLQSLLSQERVKLRTSSLAGAFKQSIRTKSRSKFWRKGNEGVSRDCPNFLSTPIISGRGKATNFKFCTHIHRIDRNKSPLNFCEK